MSEAYDVVAEILTGKFQVPAEQVTPEATLGALELDSLALVEFDLTLQERIGVRFGSDAVTAGTTLAEAADGINTKLAAVDAATSAP
ncbi:acyl carrier protein [Streptomyces sp. ISL-96]|uniref:acyl carrier protein n=1 Tax=Streptomyces sp. ISL-96 TaxID=2819191 RepID=UPI001BEB008B|nr:acyl carrier protein [Streptomyces sp. ISL-96]MBT2493933.1 acyl carrier protein [Streptomyces sp. ISL-96]